MFQNVLGCSGMFMLLLLLTIFQWVLVSSVWLVCLVQRWRNKLFEEWFDLLWNLSIGHHDTKSIMYEIIFHYSVGRCGWSKWRWGIHLKIKCRFFFSCLQWMDLPLHLLIPIGMAHQHAIRLWFLKECPDDCRVQEKVNGIPKRHFLTGR